MIADERPGGQPRVDRLPGGRPRQLPEDPHRRLHRAQPRRQPHHPRRPLRSRRPVMTRSGTRLARVPADRSRPSRNPRHQYETAEAQVASLRRSVGSFGDRIGGEAPDRRRPETAAAACSSGRSSSRCGPGEQQGHASATSSDAPMPSSGVSPAWRESLLLISRTRKGSRHHEHETDRPVHRSPSGVQAGGRAFGAPSSARALDPPRAAREYPDDRRRRRGRPLGIPAAPPPRRRLDPPARRPTETELRRELDRFFAARPDLSDADRTPNRASHGAVPQPAPPPPAEQPPRGRGRRRPCRCPHTARRRPPPLRPGRRPARPPYRTPHARGSLDEIIDQLGCSLIGRTQMKPQGLIRCF